MILKNFVVFEGIDGSGTTTQMQKLESRFAAEGKSGLVRFTREPTANEIGRLLRQFLSGKISAHPDTLAFLFAADRNEHLFGRGGIAEETGNGRAVFSDRYLFSSLAYQGESGSPDLPQKLNGDFPLPEYVFFFDLDPETAMQRILARSTLEHTEREIFEETGFQKQVSGKYKSLFASFRQTAPDMHILTIDAALPPEEIAGKIWKTAGILPKFN